MPSAVSSPGASVADDSGDAKTGKKGDGTRKQRSKNEEGNDSGAPDDLENGEREPEPQAGGDRGNGSGNLSTASASVRDTAADAEVHGDAPAYAEITGASITGRGNTVRLQVSLADAVPTTLEEDTFMVVEIRIEHRKKEYSVYANGTERGWEGFVSDGSESQRARGFRIEGSTILWEPRWSDVGGPGRFTWFGGISWTRSTLTRTHYAFDAAPNDYRARFPGR